MNIENSFCLLKHFNSQPHEEADEDTQHNDVLYQISTHSLTRRLTMYTKEMQTRKKNFNSQPHEEADKPPNIPCRSQWYFNSQPHEEADSAQQAVEVDVSISTHSLTRRLTLILMPKLSRAKNFNSQPHEEADSNFKQKSFYLKLFFIFIA